MKLNRQTYTQRVAPTTEPVSLESAKVHLRIDSICTDEDTLITALITTARQSVENYCNILLGSQQWTMFQDYAEYNTELNNGKLISIESYQYLDSDGALKEMSDYTTVHNDLESTPARVNIEEIPTLYDEGYNQIIIKYTAGLVVIPAPIQQAMLMMIGHWYENRQDVVTGTQVNEMPEASKYLMNPYANYELR